MPEDFGRKPSVATRFASDVFSMPRWQKITLSVAALLGIGGVAGQAYSSVTRTEAPPAQVESPAPTSVPPAPNGGSGFVGAGQTAAKPEAAPPPPRRKPPRSRACSNASRPA